MDGCHYCQQEFKLVNSSWDVTPETEAEDLKESLQVVENDKAYLELPMMLEVVLPWFVVHSVPGMEVSIQDNQKPVFRSCDKYWPIRGQSSPEGDGGGDEGIEDSDGHDHDVEHRVVDDLVTDIGSIACPLEIVNSHKTPFSLAITLKNLLWTL